MNDDPLCGHFAAAAIASINNTLGGGRAVGAYVQDADRPPKMSSTSSTYSVAWDLVSWVVVKGDVRIPTPAFITSPTASVAFWMFGKLFSPSPAVCVWRFRVCWQWP
jgi:hypothetical protein